MQPSKRPSRAAAAAANAAMDRQRKQEEAPLAVIVAPIQDEVVCASESKHLFYLESYPLVDMLVCE